MSDRILARINDLVANLNKALEIANTTPGLIVLVRTNTVLPKGPGLPHEVTVHTVIIQPDDAAAATQDAPPS